MIRAMSLRAAQKQMTRELFLTKALELFETKGYAATTIDDIATAAGSNRTTFYLHFSSKAEVVSALLMKVDAILTADDDPPLTAVVASGSRDLIRTWLDRKFTQWDVIKPYLLTSYQAAYEPDVVATDGAVVRGRGRGDDGRPRPGRSLPPGPATHAMRPRLRRTGVPVPAVLRGGLAHPAQDRPGGADRLLVPPAHRREGPDGSNFPQTVDKHDA